MDTLIRLGQHLAFAVALNSAPATALAEGICDDLVGVIGAHIADTRQTPLDLSKITPFTTASQCGESRTVSGVRALHCMQAYPYRSSVTHRTFSTLSNALAGCSFTDGEVDNRTAVNHPDSYEQRSFLFGMVNGTWRIDLSLKDKASLKETYLILRVWEVPR